MLEASAWTLVTYRLPTEDGRARIATWRQIRRSGALHLQQSLVAFPDHPDFAAAVAEFRAAVGRVGGDTLALAAQPVDDADRQRLRAAWNDARDAEYRELTGKCKAFLEEIDHEFAIAKFTLAELEEEEAELDKLERWHQRIAARDIHHANRGEPARHALQDARSALRRYADAVYHHTQPHAAQPDPAAQDTGGPAAQPS